MFCDTMESWVLHEGFGGLLQERELLPTDFTTLNCPFLMKCPVKPVHDHDMRQGDEGQENESFANRKTPKINIHSKTGQRQKTKGKES